MPPVTTQPDVMSEQATILSCRGVKRSFRMGDSDVQVLRGVDLSVRAGEFLAIEGRSGSGKSTLLHILGALDKCDGGQVFHEGRDIAALGSGERAKLRNGQFGFVFQFYHLLPELNVLENTMLAPMIQFSWTGFFTRRRELRRRAAEVLGQLGMEHRLKHRPAQLSGGERQRVAIARALMNSPRILMADEPTGNLDTETGQQIMRVLEDLHRSQNLTVIMVTHDRSLARRSDRVLILRDGTLHPAD
jgi:lipoprotein-releasing system ATP-binding protein